MALKFLWPLRGDWFVERSAVGAAVGDYLQIAAYGIFFVGASFAYSALLMSSGKTRALIPATILLAATSIPLSYALIFGKFGFARMGMRGAALGSLAAKGVTFLFLTIYVVRAFDSARYKLFRILSVDWRTLRLLSRISASIATQRSLEVIPWFVFFLILERVSLEALAGEPLHWQKPARAHRSSAARRHPRRAPCNRTLPFAGAVYSPLVRRRVRFGMGTSGEQRCKPSRGRFGDASCHPGTNVVRRGPGNRRHSRSSQHRVHTDRNDAGHRLPYRHPFALARRVGLALLAHCLGGLPLHFLLVDEVAKLAAPPDLTRVTSFHRAADLSWPEDQHRGDNPTQCEKNPT